MFVIFCEFQQFLGAKFKSERFKSDKVNNEYKVNVMLKNLAQSIYDGFT